MTPFLFHTFFRPFQRDVRQNFFPFTSSFLVDTRAGDRIARSQRARIPRALRSCWCGSEAEAEAEAEADGEGCLLGMISMVFSMLVAGECNKSEGIIGIAVIHHPNWCLKSHHPKREKEQNKTLKRPPASNLFVFYLFQERTNIDTLVISSFACSS